MALEQKLSLKLSQKLVMTPALQQAIKLLQMTRLELEGVVKGYSNLAGFSQEKVNLAKP